VRDGRRARRRALVAAVAILAMAATAAPVAPQAQSVRDALAALEVEPLTFHPPDPERQEVAGVDVLLLEDHALPLVTVYARFRGGYGLFDREWYAVAMGLPALLRYGGTATLTPDSVDKAIDYYAVQTAFGTGGGSISSSVNVLREHLPQAMTLWRDLLTRPRFDEEQVELWRERQLEGIRRREDDPGSLAFAEFNRLLYGDHPVGWEMGPSDLEPGLITHGRLRGSRRGPTSSASSRPWPLARRRSRRRPSPTFAVSRASSSSSATSSKA
jgi:zinc protease